MGRLSSLTHSTHLKHEDPVDVASMVDLKVSTNLKCQTLSLLKIISTYLHAEAHNTTK